ncbi:hypothetical protein BVX97_04630 [bacterium E08(2017)]|nr:hypothetical protein BVX97_04630 [bacterium E08(2017)]
MKNIACAEVVRNSLKGLIGIKPQDVVIDLNTRTVTVQYESLVTAKKNVEYAIARSGFDANAIPADKEAAAKLPKECRE